MTALQKSLINGLNLASVSRTLASCGTGTVHVQRYLGNAARGPMNSTDLQKQYNYAKKFVTGPPPLSYDELKQRSESLRTFALFGVATLGAIDLMLASERELQD